MWEQESAGPMRRELAALIGEAARLADVEGDEAGGPPLLPAGEAGPVARGMARLCGMDVPQLQQYLDRAAAAVGADRGLAAFAAAVLLGAAMARGELYTVTDAGGGHVCTESGTLTPIDGDLGHGPSDVLFFIGRGAAERFRDVAGGRIGVALRACQVPRR